MSSALISCSALYRFSKPFLPSSSRVFPDVNRKSISLSFHPLKPGKCFSRKKFNSITCIANHSSSIPFVDEKISTSSSPNVIEEISSSPSLIVNENISSSTSPIVEEKISWVDKYLPEPARPYARLARLDMPVGIGLVSLLTWPFLWSIALAAPQGHFPDFNMLNLFALGVYPFRAATMTINDILDYDIDKKISRTKSRPIANGDITPFQGFCLLALEILLGVGILFPFMNNYSRLLVIPFLFLMCTYPLMKRITYWPQAYLGLNLSWGALIGWAAMKGSCDWKIVLPLYIGGVFWTLVYETIYGHQDKLEDIKMGVKSVPVLLGDSSRNWMAGFGVACIASLALCGYNAQIGWPYFVSLAAALGQLAWQVFAVDLSSPADCKAKFHSNKWFGVIMFWAIVAGRLFS
ncbi:4-hydroxybenzoate polyprenyltransferase, mitochondrial [Quillaja saponaria]|uniref:4-hydroxybenzoate polyprenyltransferase, mitochondrial n=1 Tax=Quillaja saponaria TaxID=32244 RepID=A0AAD7LMB4_QUISA|nr:4-hydroxybenzoate polyprenyltransferase, mitochondrial [Quillaja saponaria]